MSRAPRNPGPSAAPRQNDYFVPRDGIDREVISADICRYLGNDALVRPGSYEDPQTGQIVQGYYITAYRNLTTAMIEDLKTDSARWDAERRQKTSHNTPGVQYQSSVTHQSRQHYGPTAEGTYHSDPYGRDPAFDNNRGYPGPSAPGYHGGGGSYQQQQPPPPFAASGGAAYGGYQQQQQQPQQPAQRSPAPDPRYSGSYSQGHSAMDQFPQDSRTYMAQDVNMQNSSNRMPPPVAGSQQQIHTSGFTQQPIYATSSYQNAAGQVPAANPSYYPGVHPSDAVYGRASPSGQPAVQPGYPPQQGQQYGDTPSSRASANPSSAQTPPAGVNKRRSDRDDDRHTSSADRHHRQPRR